MTAFTQARNVELSLLSFLTTQINANWSGVSVVKTQKQVYAKDIELPVVCCRLADTSSTRREIGSTTLEDRYLVIIDIYAESDGQRIDLSYFIKQQLKEGWIHYNHSHNSGSTSLTQVENGRDWVTDWISDSQVDLGQDADKKDKFRNTISIRIRHQDA